MRARKSKPNDIQTTTPVSRRSFAAESQFAEIAGKSILLRSFGWLRMIYIDMTNHFAEKFLHSEMSRSIEPMADM